MYSKTITALIILPISASAYAIGENVRDRAGHWESTLMVVNQGEGSIQGKAGGDVDFKNDKGWGFSFLQVVLSSFASG